jgi:hypothetical protein
MIKLHLARKGQFEENGITGSTKSEYHGHVHDAILRENK